MVLDIELSIGRTIAALDVPRVRETFRSQDEFVFLERSLDAAMVDELVSETAELRRKGNHFRSLLRSNLR